MPFFTAKNKGVLPAISFASISAPLLSKKYIMYIKFRSAAQCKAVFFAYFQENSYLNFNLFQINTKSKEYNKYRSCCKSCIIFSTLFFLTDSRNSWLNGFSKGFLGNIFLEKT